MTSPAHPAVSNTPLLTSGADARPVAWRTWSLAWLGLAVPTAIIASLANPWLWLLVMVWLALSVALALGLVRHIDLLHGQVADYAARLESARERIDSLATRDELTEVWNKRQLMELLEQHAAQTRRSGSPLCLALLDIDHMANINAQHGERVGDEVLKRFAKAAQAALRNSDFLGRIGGDEFLLVFPASLPAEAEVALNRLRGALATLPLADLAPGLTLTCSGGLVRLTPTETLDAAIGRADEALGKAATAGRNQIHQG
jgi:diguanylate cyclase (GGDEF)-like protein